MKITSFGWRVLVVSLCVGVVACSGSKNNPAPPTSPTTPTTPAPPAATTYSVTGSVTDQQSGRAIASALVRVMDGADANKAAVTDANGAYSLTGLQAGQFELNISASGYSSLSQKVTLQTSTTMSFALQVGRRTISGTITDATSRGVLPNILIVAVGGTTAGQSTRSDAQGRYALSGVSTDTTGIQASATSYFTGNWSVPTGGDVEVNIVMTRTGGTTSPPPTPAPPRPEPTPPAGGVVITFSGGSGGLTSYTEGGFTVTPTAASWAFNGYGVPAPSIQFSTGAGVTLDGEVRITSGGSRFQFKSVDVYSSTTQIPWVFTGLLNGATVYSVAGRQGNTFGNFATVANGQASASVDTLLIRLSNIAAPCCGNPMGLDNVVLTR